LKSTGIVRRIDDVGRILIPKDIVKKFAIKNKDQFEIFLAGETICIQKYYPGRVCEHKINEMIIFLDNEIDNIDTKNEIREKLNDILEMLKKIICTDTNME